MNYAEMSVYIKINEYLVHLIQMYVSNQIYLYCTF